jgi:hypothetical protein
VLPLRRADSMRESTRTTLIDVSVVVYEQESRGC